jgi:hypothetical protein
MNNIMDSFALIEGRRRNKFAFELLRDAKFRSFLRNKVKEVYKRNDYSNHVCSMEGLEIGLESFQSTCTLSMLRWAEKSNFDILQMLEEFKHCCVPTSAKKEYLSLNEREYLLSFAKEGDPSLSNFSVSEEGEKYIAYERNGHHLHRSAAALYKDALRSICGNIVPEVVANRAGELFADEWKAYALSFEKDKFKLVIDESFEEIYSSENCLGNFGSCMEDSGFETMYHAFDGAKACSLRDSQGFVVARAILWEHVYDSRGGGYYVYLDRQYSSDGRRDLKELLIRRVELYKGKSSPFLYKPSDCSCTYSCNICTSKGDRFVNAEWLRVESSLTADDTVCYMDTFKYLDLSNGNCYTQTPPKGCNKNIALLETTDGMIEMAHVWSEYEQEYIPRNEAIYSEWHEDYIWEYHTSWSTRLRSYVSSEDPDLIKIDGDFYTQDDANVIWIEFDNKYHLMDDGEVVFCEDTGIYTLSDNAFYYEPDDSWYEYAENMPSEEDDKSSNKEDDNTKEEDFIGREKSARIVIKDINGIFKEVEYPHDLLLKSEEDFLNVVETYNIGGLDWYDSQNVLRLYTEDALAEAICQETWRSALQRQIEICKKNIEHYKKKKETLCEN